MVDVSGPERGGMHARALLPPRPLDTEDKKATVPSVGEVDGR
jgi:hypothetical protein